MYSRDASECRVLYGIVLACEQRGIADPSMTLTLTVLQHKRGEALHVSRLYSLHFGVNDEKHRPCEL